MPFELRFYGDDPSVVLAEVQALLNIGQRVEVHIKETPADVLSVGSAVVPSVAKPAARGRAKKPEQIDLEDAIREAKSRETAPAPETVSKDELRAKLIELMNAKGEAAPSELLQAQFSVSKIGELDPEQYRECFMLAEDALAGE
jgi:hypothetical protein